MKTKSLILAILSLFGISSFSQKLNLSLIIEKAGKQRLLCEQVTKSYLMIGAAIKTDDAKLEFDDAKFAFSKNLLFLNENCKSEDSKLAILSVINFWNEFKIIIASKPSRENANIAINQSNLVIKSCNEMVNKIFAEFNLKNTRLFGLCNKQRLNSQKIAKLCIAKNWNIIDPDLEKNLNEVLTSYEFSLQQMLLSNENTPEIIKILNQQLKEWSNFKPIFLFENKTVVSETVVENTNNILNEWSKLASIYQKTFLNSNVISGL